MSTNLTKNDLENALYFVKENFQETIKELEDYLRIPSISFDGYDKNYLQQAAEFTASLLEKAGLDIVTIETHGNSHPYVYGEKRISKELPTLLLYAHYDVQPPADRALWHSDPFVPEIREGRLYARGAGDDKAGVMVHVASIAAWIKTSKTLPVNLKVIIDGEEEIGSPSIKPFLEENKKRFSADTIIITDLSNYETGIPSLTTSLRGLVVGELTVKTLDHPLHSGMWGGPLPDAAMALAKILSSLVNDDGSINIAGIYDDIIPPSATELHSFNLLNMSETILRKQSGVLDDSQITLPQQTKGGALENHGAKILNSLWRLPALSVNILEAGKRMQTGNVLHARAFARIGIRLVAGMDPVRCGKLLEEKIKSVAPWGAKIEFKIESSSPAWMTDTEHPVFKAACEANKIGYGAETSFIGSGGSIPFVKQMTDALGGVPALLCGIEDPYTNAHGENESLNLSDFEKAIASQTALFYYVGTRQNANQ